MFNRRLAVALSAVLLVSPTVFAAPPETDDEKTLYALGLLISQNLASFNLSADELQMVHAGMSDSLLGRDTHGVDPAEYQSKLQALAQGRAAAMAADEKSAAADFVAAAAAAPGAVTTDSGLVYTVVEEGSGDSPQPTDRVKVHYHGTLRDGTVFDSSVERGEPATFGLNQVIACWTEGVGLMKVGGKSKLVCPPDIAYGDRGAGPIKPGSALTFEVELLEIVQQ